MEENDVQKKLWIRPKVFTTFAHKPMVCKKTVKDPLNVGMCF